MNRVVAALQFIPADERSVWVNMAMAIKTEFGDAGFAIWDDWSQTAHNYNAGAARSVWRSCKGAGITIGTLIHEAKQYGFKDDQPHAKPTREQIEARARASAERASQEGRERMRLAGVAAEKAAWIMEQCKSEQHAYLQTKGFPEMEGLVWRPDEETNLLCIPMFVRGNVASVQMIDKHGAKKFLSNGITAGAEFVFDSGAIQAIDFWVEGFASGLSLRACLGAIKQPCRIHVCFSAQNLTRMAHSGLVIADNDASCAGQKAASATGLPYWLPPVQGEDINDTHKANGTFKTSQMLRKWMQELRAEAEFYKDG